MALNEQIVAALTPLNPAGGIWAQRNPRQPIVWPFMVFSLVTRSYNMTLDGPTDMQLSRVQVDAYGQKHGDVSTLIAAARAALLASFIVGSIDEQDMGPDPDLAGYRRMLDVTIWSTSL